MLPIYSDFISLVFISFHSIRHLSIPFLKVTATPLLMKGTFPKNLGIKFCKSLACPPTFLTFIFYCSNKCHAAYEVFNFFYHTPPWCWLLSLCNTVSPVFVLYLPDAVHLLSLIPMQIVASHLCCNLCQLFCGIHDRHVQESNSGLGFGAQDFHLLVSGFLLALITVVHAMTQPSHPVVLICFVVVSATWVFSVIGLLAWCPTHNLEDQLVWDQSFPSRRTAFQG